MREVDTFKNESPSPEPVMDEDVIENDDGERNIQNVVEIVVTDFGS